MWQEKTNELIELMKAREDYQYTFEDRLGHAVHVANSTLATYRDAEATSLRVLTESLVVAFAAAEQSEEVSLSELVEYLINTTTQYVVDRSKAVKASQESCANDIDYLDSSVLRFMGGKLH